ncbi:hypothetical protein GBA52_024301 [Prunus armeniaca]|nr:hypothetical protein GBA52_024301 [Prunus armeniaca]
MSGYPHQPPGYGYGSTPPPGKPYAAPQPGQPGQPGQYQAQPYGAPAAPYGAPSAPYGAPSAPYACAVRSREASPEPRKQRRGIPAIVSGLWKPVRGSGAVVVPTRYGPERGGLLSDGGSGRQWLHRRQGVAESSVVIQSELQLEDCSSSHVPLHPNQHQEDR